MGRFRSSKPPVRSVESPLFLVLVEESEFHFSIGDCLVTVCIFICKKQGLP